MIKLSIFLLLLVLVACTVNPPQTINVTQETPLPPPVAMPEPEKFKIEPTQLHPCAPLEENAGLTLCNLTIQRSQAKPDGCEQAFISPAIPFPRITIDITELENADTAKEKYEWLSKTTGRQNNASKYSLPFSFIFSREISRQITFLKNNKVIRITETPTGACIDIDRFVKETYRKG